MTLPQPHPSPLSSAPSLPRDIQATELAALCEAAIVDIRTADERTGELGFIPGSRSFPEGELEGHPKVLRQSYAGDRPLVLVCLTGKRCRRLVPQIQSVGFSQVATLRGGLLAWRSAGLPVCGVDAPGPGERLPLEDLSEFPRAVISCFVAESVETQLDRGLESLMDPKSFVEQILGAGVKRSVPELSHALDRLAEAARAMGHPLEHIAANLDRMRATLSQFA